MVATLNAVGVLIPHTGIVEVDSSNSQEISGVLRECADILRDSLNVNVSYVTTDTVGDCSNGTCSGLFSVLQNDRADFSVTDLAENIFDGFKLQFVEVIGANRENPSYIASHVNKTGLTKDVDVLSSMAVMPPDIIAIFYASIFTAFVMFGMAAKLNFTKILFNYFRLSVKQPEDIKSPLANFIFFRIFLLSITIPTFLYLTIASNLITTDIVVIENAKLINTLRDLLNSDRRMLFVNGDGAIERFQSAKSGTLKQLWKRPGKVFVHSTEPQKTTNLLRQDYSTADGVDVVESLQRLSCVWKLLEDKPLPGNDIHSSITPFATDLHVKVMRRSRNPRMVELRQRLANLVTRRFESGITEMCNKAAPAEIVNQMFANGDIVFASKLEKCLAKKSYTQQKNDFVRNISLLGVRRLITFLIVIQAAVLIITYNL